MSSQAHEAYATRIELLAVAALLLTAIGVAVVGLHNAKKYPNLRIEAEPYEFPRGCAERDLLSTEWIPKRCTAHKYRLRNATELGLITTGKGTRWYRIGDDAALLVCFRLGKYCEVRERFYSKFVRFGYYRDLAERKETRAKPQGRADK